MADALLAEVQCPSNIKPGLKCESQMIPKSIRQIPICHMDLGIICDSHFNPGLMLDGHCTSANLAEKLVSGPAGEGEK